MKIFLGFILYIILFAVEYRKHNGNKLKTDGNILKCSIGKKAAVLFLAAGVFIFSAPAFAYCSAVSACKISDIKQELKQNEQNEEIEKAINDYLNKKVIFYGTKKAGYKNFNYDDLFIYRTAV